MTLIEAPYLDMSRNLGSRSNSDGLQSPPNLEGKDSPNLPELSRRAVIGNPKSTRGPRFDMTRRHSLHDQK